MKSLTEFDFNRFKKIIKGLKLRDLRSNAITRSGDGLNAPRHFSYLHPEEYTKELAEYVEDYADYLKKYVEELRSVTKDFSYTIEANDLKILNIIEASKSTNKKEALKKIQNELSQLPKIH